VVDSSVDLHGVGEVVTPDLQNDESNGKGAYVHPAPINDVLSDLLHKAVITRVNSRPMNLLQNGVRKFHFFRWVDTPNPDDVVLKRLLFLVKGAVFRVWYRSILGRLVVKYQYRFDCPIRKRKLFRRGE
jgi:hypothetical protein